MPKDNTYETSGGAMSGYDKDHSSFRTYEFQKYMALREKEFINNFRFEGDSKLTRAKQRTLLRQAFRYGNSGIINFTAAVKAKLGKADLGLLNILNPELKGIVKEDHIPVAVFPSMWNTESLPVKGIGNTTPLHNIGKKEYDVDASNTAMLTYDDNYKSGYWWWLLPAYIAAMGKTVMKKRLSMIDAKLVNNKVNNTQRNIAYDSVYAVNESFVELAPDQKSITGGKAQEIDIMSMLDTKLKKLDLSNGETINDILAFLKEHEKTVFTEMGKRVNTEAGSGERSISMDFESVEAHWRLREKELEDMMNIFCENYLTVFGVKLTMISTTQETIQDLRDREIEKAGHADAPQKEGKDA